jgi:hypothetical protein
MLIVRFLHSPHFANKAPNKAVGELELKGHSLAAKKIETRAKKGLLIDAYSEQDSSYFKVVRGANLRCMLS